MINFFPIRYQDELLYSVICRYKEMSGLSSKKAVTKALFNVDTYRISTLLTQNIGTLAYNLPKNCLLTADKLINENTLYPFYTAFFNQERKNTIYSAMLHADTKSIEARMGIKNWQCNTSPRLKYCPVCYKEDMSRYGESYWRRLFQVPGVLICPYHYVALKESGVWSNSMQLEFDCADDKACDTKSEYYSNEIIRLNTIYTNNCSKLLKQLYKSRKSFFFKSFYIDILRRKQLASINGSIYMKNLLEEFYLHYGKEYLQLMNSDFDIENKSNWLRVFVRTTDKNRSPLRHLLLLQFLGVEVEELFSCNEITGKVAVCKAHTPTLNREDKRKKWLQLLEENPGVCRSKLKEKASGLHSWLFRHDREWYDSVTPLYKIKPKRQRKIDYELLDQQSLMIVRKVVQELLSEEKKPIRITYTVIKRKSGVNVQVKNGNYPLTFAYINEVTEDIRHFRIRKIRWAIHELYREGKRITKYKVQLKAGFGGNKVDDEVKELITDVIREEIVS